MTALDDVHRRLAAVTAEHDAAQARHAEVTAQHQAALAAHAAALDAGEIDRAREHATDVDRLAPEVAQATAELTALEASKTRLGAERVRLQHQAELAQARDLAAASALAVREAVEVAADLAEQLADAVRAVDAAQRAMTSDAQAVVDLEIALGQREPAVVATPRPGDSFLNANPALIAVANAKLVRGRG